MGKLHLSYAQQQKKTDNNIGITAIRSLFREFFGRLLDYQDMGNHYFRTLLNEWTVSYKVVDHEGTYENLVDIKKFWIGRQYRKQCPTSYWSKVKTNDSQIYQLRIQITDLSEANFIPNWWRKMYVWKVWFIENFGLTWLSACETTRESDNC